MHKLNSIPPEFDTKNAKGGLNTCGARAPSFSEIVDTYPQSLIFAMTLVPGLIAVAVLLVALGHWLGAMFVGGFVLAESQVWWMVVKHIVVRRRLPGRCRNCAYRRDGLSSDERCPECGETPPESWIGASTAHLMPRSTVMLFLCFAVILNLVLCAIFIGSLLQLSG